MIVNAVVQDWLKRIAVTDGGLFIFTWTQIVPLRVRACEVDSFVAAVQEAQRVFHSTPPEVKQDEPMYTEPIE